MPSPNTRFLAGGRKINIPIVYKPSDANDMIGHNFWWASSVDDQPFKWADEYFEERK